MKEMLIVRKYSVIKRILKNFNKLLWEINWRLFLLIFVLGFCYGVLRF